MRNYLALNHIFRALADPTRRHIIEHLCDEEASVMVIAEPLPLSLAQVMRHLKALENRGLIVTQKSGRVRNCSVEPEALRLLDQWITERRSRFERRQPQAAARRSA